MQSIYDQFNRVGVKIPRWTDCHVGLSALLAMTFVLFLSCIVNYAVFAADSEILHEQYYLIKSKGVDIGFINERQRKNNSNIITEIHIEQRFKRENDNIEIIQDQAFVEDETGKPLEFSFESKNPGEDVSVKGKFDWANKEIVINSNINSVKDVKTIDIQENILFPYAIDKLYKESKDGIIQYNTIEPGMSTVFLKIKANEIKNEKGEHKKYKLDVNIFPNAEMYEWRDSNGREMKSTSSIMDIEQVAADEKDVLNIRSDYNVFPQSVIKVDRVINSPETVEQAIYKITSYDVPVETIFISDETQNVFQVQDNTAYIKVKAQKHYSNEFPYPFDTREYEEYLKSGPYIITDSPKVKEVAQKLSEGETDALKLALKAERWVYDNITNKNLGVDFANAVQVLETGSGDCTEHSVLLASILRAAGIPAKVVVGLVYTNTPENAFVYHMWVKAFVGRWENLDPSFPYKNFTPLHLAITESSMNDISAKTEMALNIVPGFSQIDIEILNASSPVVTEMKNRPEVKISLNQEKSYGDDNLINVVINRPSPVDSDIHMIELPNNEETRDEVKAAFYNFTRGNTEDALKDLKEFHKTIDNNDDFAKMKLALKLINMSYLNFASEVLNEIKSEEIWGTMIYELNRLYFPRNSVPDKLENVQVTAFYLLTYKDQPEMVIEVTNNLRGYDYIHYLRAKAYKELKKYQEAENEISIAMSINQENLTYRLEAVNIFSAENKIRPAQLTLNSVNLQAKKFNIKNKDFWKKFKSYDYWLKVKEFREDPVMSKYYEAQYYVIKGELDIASDILSKLVYTNNEAYLSELLGEVYYEVDQFESARKCYDKALLLDQNRVKALIGLGNIYFISGNNKLAENYYQQAVDKFPQNVDALTSLAKLHGYLGNTKKSYEYFQKILTLDKNNSDVIYNLGIILANKGKFEEAEKLLKKALSSNPMQSLIWLDLAKVRIAKHDYLESAKYLQNVKYIDENNPYYYYFMGVIYNKNNRPAEAEKYFKKAVLLKPELEEEIKGGNEKK